MCEWKKRLEENIRRKEKLKPHFKFLTICNFEYIFKKKNVLNLF